VIFKIQKVVKKMCDKTIENLNVRRTYFSKGTSMKDEICKYLFSILSYGIKQNLLRKNQLDICDHIAYFY
jgi:hypothetical protein